MPSTSFVQIHLSSVGDVVLNQLHSMTPNVKSAMCVTTHELQIGRNTIFPPDAVSAGPLLGFELKGILIVPAATNVNQIVLSYVSPELIDPNSAYGIILHPTNPTFLAMGQLQALVLIGTLPTIVTIFWI